MLHFCDRVYTIRVNILGADELRGMILSYLIFIGFFFLLLWKTAFLFLRFLLNICMLYVKILVPGAGVNFVPTLFINGRIDSDGI